MSPDYNQLFVVHEDHSLRGGGLRATPGTDAIQDHVGLLYAEYKPRKAIRFDRHSGKRVCDVIWTGYAGLPLISKPFRDVLRREGLTGWTTYPVVVYDQEGKQLRGYAGLAVTGRSGRADYSRSKKAWREPLVDGGPKFQVYVGLRFENDHWDGSDLSIPEGWGGIIVSQRTVQALRELKLPNVRFVRLSEYEVELATVKSSLRRRVSR